MTTSIRVGLVAALALAAAPVALAQDADPVCELRSANGFVRVAICAEALDDEALAAEGRRICGDDRPCGSWFWLSEEDAPEEAPARHDELTPEQVRSAMGIYVADQDSLVRIDN